MKVVVLGKAAGAAQVCSGREELPTVPGAPPPLWLGLVNQTDALWEDALSGAPVEETLEYL